MALLFTQGNPIRVSRRNSISGSLSHPLQFFHPTWPFPFPADSHPSVSCSDHAAFLHQLQIGLLCSRLARARPVEKKRVPPAVLGGSGPRGKPWPSITNKTAFPSSPGHFLTMGCHGTCFANHNSVNMSKKCWSRLSFLFLFLHKVEKAPVSLSDKRARETPHMSEL